MLVLLIALFGVSRHIESEGKTSRRRSTKKRLTAYDLYQLFVGEIGIPRREFLYDIQFWEVRRIIRGYHARHHAGWEQARLIAYNAHFCMGLPDGKVAPTLQQWIKFPWEQDPSTQVSPDDVKELQDEMAEINAKLAQQ